MRALCESCFSQNKEKKARKWRWAVTTATVAIREKGRSLGWLVALLEARTNRRAYSCVWHRVDDGPVSVSVPKMFNQISKFEQSEWQNNLPCVPFVTGM